MTKAEFLKTLKERADLGTIAQADAVYRSLFEVLWESLKAGEPVAIGGFGTFKVVQRAARRGRNPNTGAEMQIPASKSVKFTPGKALKDSL
ncbi:MAG: HU family DNA-binding protein [Desulfovibrio sp.]|jgi:DNA-binding protein HU-beta|nr:HU family DNA-binding protein [Desulfovibrio sp.]